MIAKYNFQRCCYLVWGKWLTFVLQHGHKHGIFFQKWKARNGLELMHHEFELGNKRARQVPFSRCSKPILSDQRMLQCQNLCFCEI